MTRNDLKSFKSREKYVNSRIEEIYGKVTNITQKLDGMPHAKNKPNYETEKYLDEKDEIWKKFEEYREALNSQLDELEEINPLYAAILHEYYMNGKKLDEVADKINYSYNEACRINGRALNEFDKLHKK